jgi:hypothetical protein
VTVNIELSDLACCHYPESVMKTGVLIAGRRKIERESPTPSAETEFLGNLQQTMSRRKGRVHLYLHIDFSICKSLDLDATQIKAKIASHLMS